MERSYEDLEGDRDCFFSLGSFPGSPLLRALMVWHGGPRLGDGPMMRGPFLKGAVAFAVGRRGLRMTGSPSVRWSPSWRLVAAAGNGGGDDRGFKWLLSHC